MCNIIELIEFKNPMTVTKWKRIGAKRNNTSSVYSHYKFFFISWTLLKITSVLVSKNIGPLFPLTLRKIKWTGITAQPKRGGVACLHFLAVGFVYRWRNCQLTLMVDDQLTGDLWCIIDGVVVCDEWQVTIGISSDGLGTIQGLHTIKQHILCPLYKTKHVMQGLKISRNTH